MLAFKDLKAILKTSVVWEKKLKDFYDVAEFAVQSRESKRVIGLLRDNLVDKLKILEDINLDRYGQTEWVQFAPDYKEEDLIPIHKISRESTPKEIITEILESEKRLKSFYATIHGNLITRNQKDLFDSIVTFKDNQISEIENLLKRDDLGS
jgi:hypothetical protein